MEAFLNLGRYRNSASSKPNNEVIRGYKPKKEVIHGFDKNGVWKKYSIYEYSTPKPSRPAYTTSRPSYATSRPSYGYSASDELRNLQNSAGKLPI